MPATTVFPGDIVVKQDTTIESLAGTANAVVTVDASGKFVITATTLSGLESDISSNASAIAINTSDIGVNAAAIGANTSDIGANTAAIGANTTAINNNASDILVNASGIASNASDIGVLQTTTAANASDIGVLQTTTAANSSDIAANTTAIGNNASDIVDLSAADVQLALDISNLDLDLQTQITNVSGASWVVDQDLQSQIDAINQAVSGDYATIAYVDAGDAANASDIAANTTAINNNASDIGVLQTTTAANASDILVNASGIAANASDILVNAAAIAANASDITVNAGDISQLETDVTTLSGSAVHGTGVANQLAVFADADSVESFAALSYETGTGLTVGNNLTVNGNLYVTGDEVIVNTETVSAADNIILINGGEPNNQVTKGYAGIRVDRGTGDDYFFMFDEERDGFAIGIATDETSGALSQTQMVATREDNPVDFGVPFWNDTEKRFDTDETDSVPQFTYNPTTNVLRVGNASMGTNGTVAIFGYEGSATPSIFQDSSDNTVIDGNTVSIDVDGTTLVYLTGTAFELTSGTTLGWNGGTTTVTDIVTTVASTGASHDNLVTEAAIRTAIDNAIESDNTATSTTVSVSAADVATETISDGGVVWYYVIEDGTNSRMGQIMAVVGDSNGEVQFTEMTTSDIGDTSGFTFDVTYDGTDATLSVVTGGGTWTVILKKSVLVAA